MKNNIILKLALVCGSLALTGCSEPDPWANLPQDCKAMVSTPEAITYENVPCSGPLDVATIINESRAEHEARFGGPYQKLAIEGVPRQVFYNGGSVKITYKKNDPTVISYMKIYPNDLDFEPQTILEFLSMTDMSVEATFPVDDECSWKDDPTYPNVSLYNGADDNRPDKVSEITIDGPEH